MDLQSRRKLKVNSSKMSLNLIRNNSSSPFRAQRSMVNQGGEGGAYESGGYDPDSGYSDGGVSEAIAGFGKIVGAGLSSRTSSDDNASNLSKKERLDKREARLQEKKKNLTNMSETDKSQRVEKRLKGIDKKQEANDAKIKEYNDIEKPTIKSDVLKVSPKEEKTEELDVSGTKIRKGLLGWIKK